MSGCQQLRVALKDKAESASFLVVDGSYYLTAVVRGLRLRRR